MYIRIFIYIYLGILLKIIGLCCKINFFGEAIQLKSEADYFDFDPILYRDTIFRKSDKQICYIKGFQIGQGRYSNVFLSWLFKSCPFSFGYNISSPYLIDIVKLGISNYYLSTLEGTPVVIKELKTIVGWKVRREISILKKLNSEFLSTENSTKKLKLEKFSNQGIIYHEGSESIIKLIDVISYSNNSDSNLGDSNNIGIVMEFIKNKPFYSLLAHLDYNDTQSYFRDLLLGLDFANSMGIFHRDIKPQNLVIDLWKKKLKIIDWGLAEYSNMHANFSPKVGSKSYKSPELLIGIREYNYSIDSWAAGCILAQMLFHLGTRKTNYFSQMFLLWPNHFVGIYSTIMQETDVLFPGWDNNDQLVKIASLLGGENIILFAEKYNKTIPKSVLNYLSKTKPLYKSTKPWYTYPKTFEFLVTDENRHLITHEALDLLSRLLVIDHEYRLTPGEALKHPYFRVPTTKHHFIGDSFEYNGINLSIQNFINMNEGMITHLEYCIVPKIFETNCSLYPDSYYRQLLQ
ncbi:casein kinase II, alpha subunit, putative [Cryptosporidium muris RN66]|uniref:non-specific serine/threonine protein kinase n=1 Tax=Cryptosporidium muris (strain RN66) TaxID=441375 RepID=B6AFF5_CRYMR|nr:casein kinase II, alpha subunit, putative [Cryptosporidium muris RN66]EEA06946.1 casein kinase II, alpha subunit, putative [Cryptosporidium muris RN66]|eukprot:XP_002141295.1 casein kinase II, alpha subunit [Cryptosporidium muris RN66]